MAGQLLAGWGRTAFAQTEVHECLVGDVQQLVKSTPQLIARGLGRGYGDCAVSGGGTTVVSTHWDEQKSVGGVAEVSAGTSLESVMREIIPTGWFVPVSPGTRFVSVGGAVASDIHGKNHHADGTFGSHVHSLTVVTADGSETICSPVQNPELFWATVGGMGLTGVITKVKFSLTPIETAFIQSETSKFDDLDSLMSAMTIADGKFRYSVAWIDMLAVGKKMGRSVLSCGDHAKLDALDKNKDEPLIYSAKQRLSAPSKVPSGLLNRVSVAVFNELWFRKAPQRTRLGIETISTFFHPLDGVKDWNHIYGPTGFIQYQFVVPEKSAHVIKQVLERFSSARVPAFLSVLKRFGEQNQGMLSFPSKGWTLAVDIPTGVQGLPELLDEMDEVVASENGRIYLAKDSRMHPRYLHQMYPRLEEFQNVRAKYDPLGKFSSNLSRRLEL